MNNNEYSFSICTLVKDWSKYKTLEKSLLEHGFVNKYDEIVTIDNSLIFKSDCYKAINQFLIKSKAKYTLVVHEDIVFNNSRADLIKELKKIKQCDLRGKVFGVAGIGLHAFHGSGHFISHKGEEMWGFKNNGLVKSLDESFLLIENFCALSLSDDLSGFHFYGSDICINAEKLGYRAYVIDFPVTHLSPGNQNEDFFNARDAFEGHLRNINYTEIVHTTCTSVYGGNVSFKKAQCLAFAMAKPAVGNFSQLKFIKKKLDAKISGNVFMFIFVGLLSNIFVSYYKAQLIYMDIIYPLLWPFRRIIGDIIWWKKTGKSGSPI